LSFTQSPTVGDLFTSPTVNGTINYQANNEFSLKRFNIVI